MRVRVRDGWVDDSGGAPAGWSSPDGCRREKIMSAKAQKKRSKTTSAGERARAAMSREARAAYGEIQQGVTHLEKSIAEIQRGLRKAEQKIEADARTRIRELRTDARAQLGVLKTKQREAAATLKHVSAAAGESWQDVKRSADSIFADASITAASVIERFRSAFGR
ncbi:MAG: hypothetical protein HYR72_07510 [Deltaproteobacteria bacterium]|nr:hypothetical protein [Deltaproteobacteria bacterium]MBI3386936.1 hypothetical protein [Deltaproteobacteria bacterium]